jgi:hypothetical protein
MLLRKEATMLGPALTRLCDRLAGIPHRERTAEQTDLLAELQLLSTAQAEITPKLAQLGSIVDLDNLGFFSITRPERTRPDPNAGGTQCKTCGQYFPVSTQPSP